MIMVDPLMEGEIFSTRGVIDGLDVELERSHHGALAQELAGVEDLAPGVLDG